MGLNPQTKQNHTTPESQKSFHDFHLPKTIQSSLEQMGFKTPTPIQADAIPVALTGNDVIGLAQTGTGKTAAFAIPTLVRLLKDPKATALVLVPTRELAAQVCEVFVALTRNNPELKTVSLIGGASMQTQERRLKSKCRILVATPGRLIDHLEKSRGLLDPTAIVILDEADRMLDMGFAPQLKQINRHLPEGRQTMLFSATFSKEIEALSMRTLKSPVKIQCVASLKPPARIEQKVLFLNGEAKNETLLDEINAREGSILIFVRTKRRTDRVAKYLASYGLKVSCIHGNKSQGQRNLAIKLFREEESRILCATDLVARGIDIPHVAHVINYDLPQVPEDYVHRIGRTARNGKTGESISFVSSDDVPNWKEIERLIGGKTASKVSPAAASAHRAPSKPAAKPAPAASPVRAAIQPAKRSEAKTEPKPTTLLEERSPALPAARPASRPARRAFPKNIRFKGRDAHPRG